MVPVEPSEEARGALQGFWLYASIADFQPRSSGLEALPRGRQVQVLEPARRQIELMEHQSEVALGLLGWMVLTSTLLSELCARALCAQFRAAATAETGEAVQARPLLREAEALLQRWRHSESDRRSLERQLAQSERERLALRDEVEGLSIHDPLTNCFNRGEFYRRLGHELSRSRREGAELSILVLEIDHLRQLRDNYGSALADRMVKVVAREIHNRCRATDSISRSGTNQFAVLLPACSASSATQLAQLLCSSIARLQLPWDGGLVSATMSIGVTALRPGQDDVDSLFSRAENAVYRAKIEGRNRVSSL